jgi:dihydrofolate reductase
MIRFIVAVDEKLGMAKNGRQPWHLPTDEQYFLQQTQKYGGVVLMGRTTYDVIGHPLKERRNIVLSRSLKYIEGVEVEKDLQNALRVAPDIWVIGGAGIFAQSLQYADELYVTRIEADFECDQFFPEFEDQFDLTSKSTPHHENGVTFTFCAYGKKS